MLRKVRKFGAVLMALTMIFVLSLGAGAAYYTTPTAANIDGTVVGTITEDGLTAAFEIAPGAAMSINYMLQGDALDSEFWNQSGAYVEIDVTLNTDGDQVYAVLPGFTSSWGWVNPTDWNGLLTKGETVTIKEPFSTYYSGGFKDETPQLIRVQLYTNSTETQNVEITVSELRIVGAGGAQTEATTTVATTTTPEPEETTTAPVEEDTTAPEEDTNAPAESEEPVESEPEDTSAPAEEEDPIAPKPEDTSAPAQDEDRPVTTTTQPNQTTSAAASTTAATTASASSDDGSSIIGPVIIIIIVVVVIAGAAVGFIIYRKKKFY